MQRNGKASPVRAGGFHQDEHVRWRNGQRLQVLAKVGAPIGRSPTIWHSGAACAVPECVKIAPISREAVNCNARVDAQWYDLRV
jgi:hypothetical protein